MRWMRLGLLGIGVAVTAAGGCAGERFEGPEQACAPGDSCAEAGADDTTVDDAAVDDPNDDEADDVTNDDPALDDATNDDATSDDATNDDPASDDASDDRDEPQSDDPAPEDDAPDDASSDDADDLTPPDDGSADDSLDDADASADDGSADNPAPDDALDDSSEDGEDVPDAGSDDTTPPDQPLREDCGEPAETGVRAYFEVPGSEGADLGDYFRLPFPNDFYQTDGAITLGDYPAVTPTSEVFVDAVNATARGFGATSTLFFRFSGPIDFDTLIPRFHLRDVTDPERTSSPPLRLLYTPQTGKYLCHNALAVRPATGYGLIPGRTYAAWLEVGIMSKAGEAVAPSAQLVQMLADEAPSDPVLAELHGKFAPFRTYLDVIARDDSEILNATVFTVGDPLEPMRRLTEQLDEGDWLEESYFSDWTLCDGENVSPCPDASGNRACGPVHPDYAEYHGLAHLPIFQQGDAPYFESGGEIDFDAPQRYEAVCVALTVPRAESATGSYPVVLYSHGAGGNFRSHVKPSVAGILSTGLPGDADPVRFAVLGYDAVQHGPRRGDDPATSGLSPDLLLFNFFNPTGTVGTALQGGIDVLSLSALLGQGLEEEELEDVGAEYVHFLGQSQGSMQGAIALPYSEDVLSAVFTGVGAGFVPSMLGRQEPAIIPNAIGQAVFDPGPNGELVRGGEFHPALALVQHLVDPVDPLHHAAGLVRTPASDLPLHVFQVYGTGDRAATAVAQKAFAVAAGLAIVAPHSSVTDDEDLGTPVADFPLLGNYPIEGGDFDAVTAGVRQYAPATGEDGHFVAFDVEDANLDLVWFLSGAAREDVPEIGRLD